MNLLLDQSVFVARRRDVDKVFRRSCCVAVAVAFAVQVIELSYYLPGEIFSSAHL